MKRRFTILTAALALLTFLAVPMGMWGQTRVDNTAKWTATSGGLGTGIGSGTITSGNFSWSYTRTLISGSSYTGWTSNCIQLGKNGGVENLTLTTSAIPGTIKSVAVECASYSAKHKVSITVGGNTYLASTATSSWTTVGTATGTGTSSGTITIAFTEGSRALYIKSITVVYDNSGGPTTYSVTYNGNGNTDGTVPTDNNAYENGDNVTVLGNTGNLAKTGHTFGGWCLNAGGTGTVYGPGSGQTATYAISANTTFYAKWTLNTHNITMPASDTYGSYSASATSNVPYGTTVTLTFAPAAGYESYIATWSVNGEAISGDTFTMPDEDVTVGVTLNNYLKDELNYSFTGVSSGGYTNWSDRTGTSGAVYAGRTAGSSSQNYLQLNNSTSSSAGAYHSGIITTGSGGKVKKVIVTWAANGGTMPDARVIKVYGSNTAYSETADLYDSDTQGTLLGSIAKGTGTTLNIAGDYKYVGLLTDGAAYFTKIEIYWEPSTDPSITAEDMQIAYDATSGSIAYTIINEVAGGDLTASVSQDSWLTLGTVTSSSVPFTCAANMSRTARTATIILTYTYNTTETVTKEVTVTQAGNPNVFDNISDINTVGTDYNVKGTVVATNSRGFIIGDGTGYVYTYLNDDPTFGVNDMVTVSGTMGNHNHVLQFTSSATVAAATSSNYNGTPAVTVITEIPDYTQSDHLSTYLQFEGELTKSSSNYFITVGEEDIQISYPSTEQTTTLNDLDGKTVRVKGYFAGYNTSNYFTVMMESVEEVTDPYITIESDAFELTADEEEGYLEITYGNFTPISFDIMYCDANGDALAGDDPDWIMLGIETPEGETGDFVYYLTEANEGPARTAYFKVYASLGEGLENVYSNLVTVTQAEYEAPSSWVLTDLADLTPADVFVIVGDNTKTYALPSTGTGSSPTATEISVNTLNEPYTLENAPEASLQWNLIHTEDGYVFYPSGETTIWLNCTNSNNGVRVSDNTNNAKHFTMDESGYLTTTETNDQRYLGIYNSKDWRTYTSTTDNISGQFFYFYKKVTDPVTYTKNDIAAYEGEKDNYYLIASPVASVTPSASNGFLTDDYDLYYFDDAQNEEWINHKAGAFNLVSGKGYLYANSGENVTLTFTGAPYFGNGLVPLQYTEGAEFAGFNLIGNPFNTNATLSMPYYRLNADGSGLSTTTESTAVNVMEGVFVQATAANAEAVFTRASSGAKSISQLNLKVTRNRGNVVDNAIIRFDEGATLGKFQLNENSTKVYFTQNDKDFAVVRSEGQGEMPVSFKAAENGNYTFSVEPESLEVSYLHLIDNMTGADVDLLATPSYSFEARTTDYANRFRLEFNTNGVEENNATANFAYFNGSSWTVNNMGEATLQVVDMMGRVLSTETISGNTEVNLNQAAGVYMLRLVTGNDVKVQKVVVR